MTDIKPQGALIKYKIKPKKESMPELENENEWLPEELVLEYNLFPYYQYKIDFRIGPASDEKFKINDFEFIGIQELEILPVEKLKNALELTDEGKILTPFVLSFKDFNKKYNKEDNNFFNLNSDEFIYNDIWLTLEKPEMKLTGRAAEIAKRRAERKGKK